MSITEGGQVATRVMIAMIDSLDKDVMVSDWCSDKQRYVQSMKYCVSMDNKTTVFAL